MPELSLWLEKSPDTPPVRLAIEDSLPEFKLKILLLSEFNSTGLNLAERPASYQVVCLRTGRVLGDATIPVSFLFRDGDSFMVRQVASRPVLNAEDNKLAKDEIGDSEETVNLERITHHKISSSPLNFSVTGIRPYSLDLSSEYPVLAVNIRYTHTGEAKIRSKPGWSRTHNLWPGVKPIYAKETFFLIADEEGQFRFESSAESNYFLPELSGTYPPRDTKRLTRYSLNEDIGECKNMIYPVRPFSITHIEMDGFNSEKAYPVLAIDVDQYFSENQENEETENVNEQSQFMAFFLVGDNNGEFAWIAEDECRLSTLEK